MFKNNECVGSMVSGAVIGVAVGMLVERVLSPYSVQKPANRETTRPECCENVKKHWNNLQVSSHHLKDSSHRRRRRSKSASRLKSVEKRCSHLSVSPALQRNGKTSVSESDLRSRSAEKRCSSRKLATKIDAKSREEFIDTSTKCPPFRPKVHENLYDKMDGGFDPAAVRDAFATASTEYIPLESKNKSEHARLAPLVSRMNNRRTDFIPPEPTHGDDEDRALYSESYGESIDRCPTEYQMLRGSKIYSEYTKLALSSYIAGRESSGLRSEHTSTASPSNTETANCSINAMFDTFDNETNFDSNYKNRPDGTEKFEGSSGKEFVTLPTFNEFANPTSADYTENNNV